MSATGRASMATRRPRARHPNLPTSVLPFPWNPWNRGCTGRPRCASRNNAWTHQPCKRLHTMAWCGTKRTIMFRSVAPLDSAFGPSAVCITADSEQAPRAEVTSNRSLFFSNPANNFIGFWTYQHRRGRRLLEQPPGPARRSRRMVP